MSDDRAIPVRVDQHIDPIAYAPLPPYNQTQPPVRVADLVQVVNNGTDHARLIIDGVVFPYATVDGFHISAGRRVEIPSVTLSIAAWRVEVIDALDHTPKAKGGPS